MSRRLFVESFIQAWQALVTNRLRTLLSLLGVMIGIFMITAVFAVSDSLEENLKGIFSSVRSDVLFVEKMPWTFSAGYPWWKYALRKDPTLEDAELLQGRLPSAQKHRFSDRQHGHGRKRQQQLPRRPVGRCDTGLSSMPLSSTSPKGGFLRQGRYKHPFPWCCLARNW